MIGRTKESGRKEEQRTPRPNWAGLLATLYESVLPVWPCLIVTVLSYRGLL